MASDILDRVGMVITDTGASSQAYVTANVLIGERFNTPQQAGAVDTKSYWWMIEEDNDFQIFEGHWDLANSRVYIETVWQSKILGVHGTAKMTLAGNATLRSVTPAEALNYLRFDTAQVLTASQKKQLRANAGVNDGNLLINGDFRINQRVQLSNVALAPGAYGHDRWKAGAAGCTYTFVQLATSTLITITAGTLMQVVEDKNVEGGSYVLSQSGTAQGRIGVNLAQPTGAFAAGTILAAGQTAGTVMSVEFGLGTLGKVKLEQGVVPTPFVLTDWTTEYLRCQRYFAKTYDYAVTPGANTQQGCIISDSTGGATRPFMVWNYRVPMRTTATVTFYSAFSGAVGKYRDVNSGLDVTANIYASGENGFSSYPTGTIPAGNGVVMQATVSAEL